MKRLLIVAAILPIMSFGDAHVERIFLKPSHSKGEVGLADNYPIDIGKWIWHPEIAPDGKVPPEGVFLRFHLDFDAIDGEKLRFDVCADERYMLRLDGEVISRGPNRGSVNNWQFQSYEARLSPGRHSMDALVWRLGEENSPIAQESWKGAFVVKAEGAYHKAVSTGVSAPWRVGRVFGTSPREPNEVKLDAFGVGCAFNVRGTFAAFEEPECWHGTITNAAWVRERLWKGHGESSVRPNGWQLYPSQMPDQLERFIAPGAFKCVREGAFDDDAPYGAAGAADARVAGLDALLRDGSPLVVPPNTSFSAIWHLGEYQCGYPVLKAAGGKGAEIRWGWAESMFTPGGKSEKGDRAAFDGLVFKGIEDGFFPDGRKGAVFSVPWWRCGLWCRIDVKTAGEPLEITRLGIVESRYPLEDDGAFECDDESLAAVRRNCLRALQMCSHETTMDCPYYEQQQYPGDSRPELMAMCAFTADDRLVRRVVESFDFARHEDGLASMVAPVKHPNDSPTYTLCHLVMHGDYAMWHANREWLRARMPGARHALDALRLYENEDGLVMRMPGWCFMDWADEWMDPVQRGCAPDGTWRSERPSAVNNLLYLLAMRSVSCAEKAFGEFDHAAILDRRAERLASSIREKFWDSSRGMVADTLDHDKFSEHAQALAIVADALPEDMASRTMEALASAKDLARCTVYFSSVLFDAYFKRGRADLFLRRMTLWKHFLDLNVTTLLESPGDSARSDCHAWGAHPAYFFAHGLAGISPDAPFFARVRVAPCPGPLKKIKCRCPHPAGAVEVDLDFSGPNPRGVVRTPVPGTFVWKDMKKELVAGENRF